MQSRLLNWLHGTAFFELQFAGIQIPTDFSLRKPLASVPAFDPLYILSVKAAIEVELVKLLSNLEAKL